MTVTVTLPDGRTDKYMRFGDAYVKHHDGGLDVVRTGAKRVRGVDRRRRRPEEVQEALLGLIVAPVKRTARSDLQTTASR
jgi:hypothetical protein